MIAAGGADQYKTNVISNKSANLLHSAPPEEEERECIRRRWRQVIRAYEYVMNLQYRLSHSPRSDI